MCRMRCRQNQVRKAEREREEGAVCSLPTGEHLSAEKSLPIFVANWKTPVCPHSTLFCNKHWLLFTMLKEKESCQSLMFKTGEIGVDFKPQKCNILAAARYFFPYIPKILDPPCRSDPRPSMGRNECWGKYEFALECAWGRIRLIFSGNFKRIFFFGRKKGTEKYGWGIRQNTVASFQPTPPSPPCFHASAATNLSLPRYTSSLDGKREKKRGETHKLENRINPSRRRQRGRLAGKGNFRTGCLA